MPTCEPGATFNPTGLDSKFMQGQAAFDQGPEGLSHSPLNLSGFKYSASTPVIRIQQGQTNALRLPILDRNGQAFPLTGETDEYAAQFIVKHQTGSRQAIFIVDCTIEDVNTLVVPLAYAQTKWAGMFVAQALITNAAGDTLYHAMSYWLEVAPTMGMPSNSMPSISELRLHLRDVAPEDNLLLEDYEVTDEEIAMCLRKPVDDLNAKYPPYTSYTTNNFPQEWRSQWINCTIAHLLKIVGRKHLRDHLDYSAGGAQVAPNKKYAEYLTIAKDLLEEWEDFVRSTKWRLNMESGFSSITSAYARRVY